MNKRASQTTYIARTTKIIPERYSDEFIVSRFYPESKYPKNVIKFANRVAKAINVPKRPAVLEFDHYPTIALKNNDDHPLMWGINIVEELTSSIPKDDIGFFSACYNLSYHDDILPNLSSQIVLNSGLPNVEECIELPYYGCAAGIYGLDHAINYCKRSNRPAIVFIFDQTSKGAKQLDHTDPYFKRKLLSNLLFTDAGVGVLVIPDHYKNRFNRPLLKIKEIMKVYKPGKMIKMTNGNFIMDTELKNVMPEIVSNKLIKPFLSHINLKLEDIHQWSIYQGGSDMIKQFCNSQILGLTENQINPSLEMFHEYGNSSAASCMLVLDHLFNENYQKNEAGTKHIMVGYGAGYYLGSALFEWE